ncbi:MAG: 23S rRNA (uracil(1939)-C(5))-methyltransferase RlmD [Alphaproteobacteria bacterium]|nr:23S rRNA (uracil(1939)-C(5))-methyltransferase RlmD [Alphaproteobacteria bacterium]
MSAKKKPIPPFETEIVKLGPKGVGVGTAPDGRPVHVRRAPPGGRVLVRPAGRRKGLWRGYRTALVRPPADGATPACPVFGLCGGCVLQELSLDAQRAHKLARAMEEVGEADWRGVRGSPDAYGFRNKMEFSFGTKRYASENEMAAGGVSLDGRFLGLHAPGRFDRIVDVADCPLLDDAGNAVLAATRDVLLRRDTSIWDLRTHAGFLRHLLIRRGEGSVYAGLFTASPADHHDQEAMDAWFERIEAIGAGVEVSAGWYVNDGLADVARGVLRSQVGWPTLEMALLGKRFSLAPLAFFQTSTAGAAVLIETIGEALGSGHRTLLDLYCGTGAIGICLSGHAAQVVGIEEVEAAIDNARTNAAANGVAATYRVAKVEDALDALVGGPGVAAVVDPPRAGLHPKVAKKLAETPLEVLVYVACNPASLGRDRELLEAGGWRLEAAWAVDLFPQTGHLEVVGRFVR